MRKHYPINIIGSPNNTVFYPTELAASNSLTKITFGTASVDVACSPDPDGRNIITISQDIAGRLNFPNLNVPLHVFTDEQTLYIGPLIGIFTSGFTPFSMRPIGERTIFFSKLLSVKKTVGALPFIFGEQHIDWEKGTIQGLFYNEQGWKSIEVPFPNVVYDRLPNRKSEKQAPLKAVKDRLQSDYLIPWYNPGFFNKLDVYERLQQYEHILPYLPETHPFTSYSMIERMLSDYGHIYMKPINGSLGLGIHQIIYDRNEEVYYCRYRDSVGENKLRKYHTLESLISNVFQNRKLSNMLVQQGIHLMRIDKRPVDFRIHTNKDEHGNWMVTALAAKIAGPGSVTTHVKSGGSIKTIEELFETHEEQKEITDKLTKAALEISEMLELQMEGILGEIGFDMGIDRKGNVWFFEANSKPGRSIFKHPHLREFDFLTRKLSLSFAVFLAEKAIKQPGEIYK